MVSPAQLTTLQPWTLSQEELFRLYSTSESGLPEKEALSRLKAFGSNDIEKSRRRGPLLIFLSQYKNPLILVLIVASLISYLTGDHLDAAIILLMILINSFLSFFQEYRSDKASSLLQRKASLKANVIRSASETRIVATDLVPGDVVKLYQGNVVPTDVRLLSSVNLLVNETLITGESFPVEKTSQPLGLVKATPQELTNSAFMGTHVESGEGLALVVATAGNTEFGRTAHSLKTIEPETEFQKGIRRFSNFLVFIILSLVIFIFLVNVYLKPYLFHLQPNYLESLLFSLALAIGITPELLPIIITINLSKGASVMAKKHVIVKKLIAIEDIGNADILCTDKTGTITEGNIFLENYLDYEGQPNQDLLLYSLLSNSQNSKTSPMERALSNSPASKEVGEKLGNYKILSELPFDFSRKRNSNLVKGSQGIYLVSKGASEEMLAKCSQLMINGKVVILSETHRRNLHSRFIQLSNQGFRLLAVAVKKMPAKKRLKLADEQNLTFLGFLAFSDRPKSTAAETLTHLGNLNVKIKLLTGDNEYVARHICQQVGLEVKEVLTGERLNQLSDQALQQAVINTTIFASITPEHKLRIINNLKSLGHTIAFVGDGANDAPALKAADVGISVDSATDVAKEAADVILLHKSLEVLIEAVKDGRRTFGNSMKYLFAVTSSNFGNMFSLAGASLLIPFIPMLPSQVILLNFLGDLPSLAISTDNVDSEYLKKPKHWDIHSLASFMVPFGLLSSFFDFSTFFLLLSVTRSLSNPQDLFRSGWFIESLLTQILVLFLIRTRRLFWRSFPSSLLLALGAGAIILGFGIVYSAVGHYFKFVSLPPSILLVIGVLTFIYLILVETGKRIYYRYVPL